MESLPTWATVVAIFMMLIGGCGACKNVQSIYLVDVFDEFSDLRKEMSEDVSKDLDDQVNDSSDDVDLNQEDTDIAKDTIDPSPNLEDDEEVPSEVSDILNHVFEDMDPSDMEAMEEAFGEMDEVLKFSDFYKEWVIRFGYIGIFIAILFALAGILLLLGKPYAIKFAYVTIALSLGFLILQIVISAIDKESGIVTIGAYINAAFMIIIDIVLLVLIMVSDKSYFEKFNVIND